MEGAELEAAGADAEEEDFSDVDGEPDVLFDEPFEELDRESFR